MKNIYIVIGLFFIIISCNTRNNNSSNSESHDSLTYSSESDAPETAAVTYCPQLVKEILKSSPRYKQLTEGLLQAVKKNGGKSVDVVLDKSPNPQKDNTLEYSTNYEMQITENYTDRQVSLAHFAFDPAKNALYEYDVVRDQLITIDYDKNLLDNGQDYCK